MSKYEKMKDGLVKDTETGAVGVFRTIGGRHIFIKDGQDLASAMKESGKFGGQFGSENLIRRIKQVLDEQTKLEKELQEISYKTYDKMTQDEIEAMNFYTANGYFDINDYLNGKYNLPYGEEIVNNINNSISKFSYDKEMTVYRGTEKYHYRNYKIGDIIDDSKRFMSSSTNISVAGVFAENEDSGLIMKIKVKPKSKGMYIGISSTMFSEKEYLLSNKQKYKVIGRSAEKVSGKTFEVLEVETYE